jgi:hypothetical protein
MSKMSAYISPIDAPTIVPTTSRSAERRVTSRSYVPSQACPSLRIDDASVAPDAEAPDRD